MRQSTQGAGVLVFLLALLLIAASLGPATPLKLSSAVQTPSSGSSILQPSLKRNVFVFLDRFLDRSNTTTPAQIQAKLDAVNAYFSAVTFGAWTFNWTLFYPRLGEPWYMVNETYAQAAANPDLTPLATVILQAYRDGVKFPAPGKYPLVPSALIFHVGNDSAMTGNSTDIWSLTTGPYCSGSQTSPPNAFCLLTAIVAETDPVGIIAHELTHELQRFDESGVPLGITLGHSVGPLPPGMVPVDWWDIMYQGLRNPNGTGTEPAEFMAWNRMSLGLLPPSQIAVVDRGQTATVTLNDLEEPTSEFQAIRIPIGNDSLSHWYYVVELRKGVSYDAYFPWLAAMYPNRVGMLVYFVNVSKYSEPFHVFLVKAHVGDANAQQALFGPCSSPCVSALSMVNVTNRVSISILSTSNSSFVVNVANAVASSSGSPCPGVMCFLGLIDIGAFSWLFNATIVVGAAVGAVAWTIKRRRAKRAHGVGTPEQLKSRL